MARQLLGVLAILAICYEVTAITGMNNRLKKSLQTELMDFTLNTARVLHNQSTLRDNIVFSPINVYAALSLSHLAAAGATRDEFADILDWPKNDQQTLHIHKNFGRMLNSLLDEDEANSWTKIKIANGLFVDQNSIINTNFKKSLENYYKSAEVFPTNFSNSSSKATEMINRYISKATEGELAQLIAKPLPPSTNLLLANTLYFNGIWAKSIPMKNTKKEMFSNYGQMIEVNMMNDVEYLPYINDSSLRFEAIAKPYMGNKYTMIYLNLHENQRHKNLSDYLTTDVMKRTVREMQLTGVEYTIPRTKFIYINGTKNALQGQGLEGVFEDTDLSNMIESGPHTKLAEIYHGLAVEIDENGTHAAGITNPHMETHSDAAMPDKMIKFTVKTPYLVCLWHVETSTCIFYGYVHKPEGP